MTNTNSIIEILNIGKLIKLSKVLNAHDPIIFAITWQKNVNISGIPKNSITIDKDGFVEASEMNQGGEYPQKKLSPSILKILEYLAVTFQCPLSADFHDNPKWIIASFNRYIPWKKMVNVFKEYSEDVKF